MRCAIFGCNSNNNKKNSEIKTSFFNFPKNPKVCKQWVFLCRRKDKFEPKNSRICSKHFQSSDFVPKNKILEEHGLSQPIRLMPNVIPSLGLPFKNEKEPTLRQIRMNKKAGQVLRSKTENQTPNEINVDSKESLCASDLETTQVTPETPFVDCNDLENVDGMETHFLGSSTLLTTGTQTETLCPNRDTQTGVSSSHTSTQTDSSYIDTQLLKTREISRLQQENWKKGQLMKTMGSIFTKGQLKKMEQPTKRMRWSEEDISNAITLYAAGPRAYRLLLEKGFPFPSVMTLQKCCAKTKL